MAGQGHHQGGVPSLSSLSWGERQHTAAMSSESATALGYREKEVQCVLHWFHSWNSMQKGEFLRLLLELALPPNLDMLYERMQTMEVRDRPPSIFQCQLKLIRSWFQEWSHYTRNDFMTKLSVYDQAFVASFDQMVQQNGQQGGMDESM